MFRRARPELALLIALAGTVDAAPDVPRGRRTVRREPTHVVLRALDVDAQGARARLAPGVAVVVAGPARSGMVTATTVGPVEVTARVEAAALGARIAADTDVRRVDGAAPIGRARAGALVVVVGRGGGGLVCDTVGPVRARVVVPADTITAEPRELVYPVAEHRLAAVGAPTDLVGAPGGQAVARLERGARLAVVDEDGAWARVRSYGAFEIDGYVARERLVDRADAPPLDEPGSKGLTPTHEALVDTPAFADAAGRRAAGTLRGGALVSVGIERNGPRVQVMTHGDVVVELWVPLASLRPLEPDIWSERN
jgi:hypothetical protein